MFYDALKSRAGHLRFFSSASAQLCNKQSELKEIELNWMKEIELNWMKLKWMEWNWNEVNEIGMKWIKLKLTEWNWNELLNESEMNWRKVK